MFFWFPKGCSWAGHKKGTTFLGSQDTDDPMHENDFLLYTKTQKFFTKIKIPLLFTAVVSTMTKTSECLID